MMLVSKLTKKVSVQKLKYVFNAKQSRNILFKKMIPWKCWIYRYIRFLITFGGITFLFLYVFTHVHYTFYFIEKKNVTKGSQMA